jgi:hypothetical protein
MNKGKRYPVLKAALWGGLLYGGFTLSIGFCDACGDRGIAEAIVILCNPFITRVPNAAMHVLGYDLKPMPTMLAWLNGFMFAAIINLMIGAAISSVLAVGVRLLGKRLKMRHAESLT